MEDEKLLTVKEFSELTGISAKTLYRLIAEDKIPAYRIYGSIRLKIADFRGEKRE